MCGNTGFVSATPRSDVWRAATRLLVLGLVLAVVASAAEAGTLERAQAALERGDWAKAADLFAEVLDKSPSNREAAIGLTRAAVKAQRVDLYRLAEEALLGLRDKHPSDWDVRIALGEISLATRAAKEDTLAKKSYDAQAIENFTAVLEARPDSAPAAAGLARTYFEAAQFQQAVDVVDTFLAKNPETSARALYWKGQALYFLAMDAHRAAGGTYPLTAQVRTLFQKAQGAYRGSAQGDETRYDTWIQYAYASQYLGDRPAAMEGYSKALVLDPESVYPLRGIEALNQREPEKLTAILREIVRENPDHPQALFFYAYNRYAAQDYAEAGKHFERFVKVARNPAEGWYWLGMTHERETNEDKAVAAFERALAASPDHAQAAWALDQRIIRSGAQQKASSSVKGAKEVIAAYQKLFKLAPRNPFVRNNLAFTLREAYVAHQGSEKWTPILMAATATYVEASEIIGEWDAEKERTLDWGQRYARAQIISDTGLMFQFYEPTRDLEKAESYYDRALEFTDNGYRDAFNNLTEILAKQERWEDLYELADVCSESIRTEQGQPDEATRARARAIVKKLQDEGKVSD